MFKSLMFKSARTADDAKEESKRRFLLLLLLLCLISFIAQTDLLGWSTETVIVVVLFTGPILGFVVCTRIGHCGSVSCGVFGGGIGGALSLAATGFLLGLFCDSPILNEPVEVWGLNARRGIYLAVVLGLMGGFVGSTFMGLYALQAQRTKAGPQRIANQRQNAAIGEGRGGSKSVDESGEKR